MQESTNLTHTSPLSQLLYDTLSAFGVIVNTPKVMRDPESGASKGFGFVSFDSFEASGELDQRPVSPPR
jgi:hypothetical protein